ncbi:MAG: HhoA/HhoB/HtrA family serine endopeptidase [Limnoraphis robusta]|jgi:S1-C subfamily serine protease|uniref:Serine protease n=1 Tax=Limnoraphis robusta CS-951 TaxID=1637645 RepID=A0A0F5YFJ5_9CYAN|nr:HhoA/HhoB/HtrA family serine endopeptidase [Limnoraphis robusta]KKD37005.1 serine protease [Limnoraphis robusta CS-951]MEA5498762.1 HhoA/HhoB/HtrA family serine endopeptidase [Limnoraphis robusta BA-68 BA1]
MSSTTEKVFWKQPILYLMLMLTGAGAALMGERWIENQTIVSSQDSPREELAPVPTPSEKEDLTANSPAWFAQKSPLPIPKTANSNFIVSAVEQVGPAVVRINASRRVGRRGLDRFDQPFPDEFFGFGEPPGLPDESPTEEGTGSGFIISSEGHILTNSHVVEDTDTVQVVLKDGRIFEGQVLGTDSVTDVAVIKIDANNLPNVRIGDSEQLAPGEWAIAIGNPLGLDNSVTVGIISATGRSSSDVGVPDKRIGFIQTDAAINPGNSGGPLLNAQGEVIGMNTAIISGAQGLGFAIPINKAQQIAQQLIATGRAEHAYLGIEMVTLSPEVKRRLNPELPSPISTDEGVLVVNVVPGSPAEQSGVQPGDVIQKVDSQSVRKSETVQQIVQNKIVGSSLQVELNRNGQNLTLSVMTGNLPPQL